MNDPIQVAVRQTLDDWQHVQLNMTSEAGRDLLTHAIAEALQPVVAEYVESIVAPDNTSPESM